MFIVGKADIWLFVTCSLYMHGRQLLLIRTLLVEHLGLTSHSHDSDQEATNNLLELACETLAFFV